MACRLNLAAACFYMTGGIKIIFFTFLYDHILKDDIGTNIKIIPITDSTEKVCPGIEYTSPINKLKCCYKLIIITF